MKKLTLTTLITGLYVIALMTFLNIWDAETSYIKFKNSFSNNQIEKAKTHIDTSINKNPNEPRYYYEKAKLEIAKNNLVGAKLSLEKAEKLNPNNLVSLRNMIPIYSYLPKEDAKAYYTKLKEIYPKDVGVLIQLAKYEKNLGLTNMYDETTSMIENLRPDLTKWAL